MPLKDDTNVIQRRKSFAKSKIFTDKDINPVSDTTPVQRSKNMIKLATPDGKGTWLDNKSHCEACWKINHWTNEEKELYLAVCLRGQHMECLGI